MDGIFFATITNKTTYMKRTLRAIYKQGILVLIYGALYIPWKRTVKIYTSPSCVRLVSCCESFVKRISVTDGQSDKKK